MNTTRKRPSKRAPDHTAAQRQETFTQRFKAAGGKMVMLRVPPDLAERMAAEMERTGESANALALRAVEALLPK